MELVKARGRADLMKVWPLIYDCYLKEGFIEANPYGWWFTHHQLMTVNDVYLVEREGEVVFTVTAVWVGHPYRQNFPRAPEYQGAVELILLASKLASIATFRYLVKVCKDILSSGAKTILIEIVAEKAQFYKKLGFVHVATARQPHFALLKYPILMALDLPALLKRSKYLPFSLTHRIGPLDHLK